jgi:sec-independent protein translocase protein TatA
MFGLGVPELIIILVVIIMIFGAGKLPEIGSALGKGIKSFKKATKPSGGSDDQSSVPSKSDEPKESSTR